MFPFQASEELIKLKRSKPAVTAGCCYLAVLALAWIQTIHMHGRLSFASANLLSLPVAIFLTAVTNNSRLIGIMEVNDIGTVWVVLMAVVASCTLLIAWSVARLTGPTKPVGKGLAENQRERDILVLSVVALLIAMSEKVCVRLFIMRTMLQYAQNGSLSALALNFIIELVFIIGSIAQWIVLFSSGYLINHRHARNEPLGWLPIGFLFSALPLLKIFVH